MRRPTPDDLKETMLTFLVGIPMLYLVGWSVFGLVTALAD
jgi:hypothetical protein